ncbi:FtsX-like permease family protein [Actinoplanes sp. NPDC048988]|uniref:FtsX-like permease family protein n=1 Tax=Actinoplanes sp. NPDC048988 TaxID=3363901 RepID=UPI00371A98E3
MAALIAIPVLALSFGAATYDMFTLRPGETYAREGGRSDAVLVWRSRKAIEQDWRARVISSPGGDIEAPAGVTDRSVLGLLPPGSAVVPLDEGYLVVRTRNGAGGIEAFATNAADQLTRGIVSIVSGTAPAGASEIAVSAAAADRLGVRPGGSVTTPDGAQSWRVTGVAEFPADLSERLLFAAGAMPAAVQNRQPTRWLAAVASPITWDRVPDFNRKGVSVASRAVYANPPKAEAAADRPAGIDMAVLVGGLGVLEVVLLAGPAFAVGARRQRRELALVAANGGTPAHLRRIVLADGVVLGGLGAAAGVTIGAVAALALRPLIETSLMHERAGGYRIFPSALLAISALAVVTAALAALVPAITAGRHDVVHGLTGRAGVVRSRRRWIVAGVALLVVGGALAVVGAVTASPAGILVAVVALEAGLVLVTPGIIGLLGRIGHVLPLPLRIALRDTARNRASAAPAVAAVMAAVAASVAIGIYFTSAGLAAVDNYRPGIPVGASYVNFLGEPPAGGMPAAVAAVRSALPESPIVVVNGYRCGGSRTAGATCSLERVLPRDQRCFLAEVSTPYTSDQQRRALADPRCDADSGRVRVGDGVTEQVGDADFLDRVLRVSGSDRRAAKAVLDAGGVVVRDRRYVTGGRITIAVRDSRRPGSGQDVPDEKLPRIQAPAYVVTSGGGPEDLAVYSPGLIRRLGFATVPAGLIALPAGGGAGVLDQAGEDRLRAALLPVSLPAAANLVIERGARTTTDPRLLIAAVVASFITIGATFIATGLAAADGRGDLATLAAVGAAPGLRRWLSLTQAGVIAGVGAVLGTVAGGAACLAVLAAYNRSTAGAYPVVVPYPLEIAWPNVAAALGVPLIAMAGAGLLTRSRLPVERATE